jgi:hypothetical protein
MFLLIVVITDLLLFSSLLVSFKSAFINSIVRFTNQVHVEAASSFINDLHFQTTVRFLNASILLVF